MLLNNFTKIEKTVNFYILNFSAAQCFTDYYGDREPIENYYVAGGKVFRKFYDRKDNHAQYSTVKLQFCESPKIYMYNFVDTATAYTENIHGT